MTDPTPPEYADIGAAAPLAASSKKSKSKRSPDSAENADRTGRPRLGPAKGAALIVVLVVLLALIPALSTIFVKTPRDKVGITYGGGPIESVSFKEVIPPGSGLTLNGMFNSFYLYPADQLVYALPTGQPDDAGSRPAVSAPSNDDVEVRYEVSVHFKLNIDELQDFHEEVGLRYEASTDEGWNEMLHAVMLPQLRNALQEQTRRHLVADLYTDPDLLVQLQRDAQAALSAQLELTTGGNYFCSPAYRTGGECGQPTVVIKGIQVPAAVQAAFERNRVAELDIAARESEAEAIAVLMDALGNSGDTYALLKAIEAGQVEFWVLPDGGVSITGPTGGGGNTDTDGPAPDGDG